MDVAMVGLGRMGMNMARRLLRGRHRVFAYNRTDAKTREIAKEGALGLASLNQIAEELSEPRIVWLMLPAGGVVDEHLEALKKVLSPGDIVLDGANSHYKDSMRRSRDLGEEWIRFMDVGVSGGIWGLQAGYCLMVGGAKDTFEYLEPLFQTLAPPEGYLYCGPSGAGHFVKMVHNGIEYGLMAAYGEGFHLLKASPYAGFLDLEAVAHLWNRGSVIRSWLLELVEQALGRDPDLAEFRGIVKDSGEGRWAVQEAVDLGIPMPVIALSLMGRFRSQLPDSFGERLMAALRREFGGHEVVIQEAKEAP